MSASSSSPVFLAGRALRGLRSLPPALPFAAFLTAPLPFFCLSFAADLGCALLVCLDCVNIQAVRNSRWTYVVRSARDLGAWMTLPASAAPTTISTLFHQRNQNDLAPLLLTFIGWPSTRRPLSFLKAVLAPSALEKTTFAMPRLWELGPYTRSTFLTPPRICWKYSWRRCVSKRKCSTVASDPKSSAHGPQLAVVADRESCTRKTPAGSRASSSEHW